MKIRFSLLLATALLAGAFVAQAQAPKPAAALKTALANGGVVYKQYCVSCHQANGAGLANVFPPLIKTDWVLGSKARLVGLVRHGLQGQPVNGVKYASAMPPQTALTDQQVADVLTYVRNSFGNKASAVTPGDVKAASARK